MSVKRESNRMLSEKEKEKKKEEKRKENKNEIIISINKLLLVLINY